MDLNTRRGLGVAAVIFASAVCSCGTATRSAAPSTVAGKGLTDGSSTQLSGSGCSVTLPGKWARRATEEGASESWDAQNSGESASLSVLAMQWKPQTPAKEWRLDLEAVLNIRRDAERNESASVTFSPIEYVDDPRNPAALFTSADPNRKERMATMVRASPKQLCVLFLTLVEPNQNEFVNRAKAVLQAVVVEP